MGISNIIDSRDGNPKVLERMAKVLVEKANESRVAILNGENAILGDQVRSVANISGTAISIVPNGVFLEGVHQIGNDCFAVFDPEDEFVYINSDGIGTKTEFYVRAHNWMRGVDDFLAMNLDDKSKIGARTRVVSGVLEYKRDMDGRLRRPLLEHFDLKAGELGFLGIMQIYESLGISGYYSGASHFNVNGSVVSTIDEARLRNPLRPNIGDWIIAIRGEPNPRSNGITAKRKAMVDNFGEHWHKDEVGKYFLNFLASPSTILSPVFDELIEKGLATSVYHMSGGAYNGKFARPLAKQGLAGSITNLFPPDSRELMLAGLSLADVKSAYSAWPMGNCGFVTVNQNNFERALDVIKSKRLEGNCVGAVHRVGRDYQPGLYLQACNGQEIYFDGR